MNKFCVVISIALAVSSFAYMFNENIKISCLFGLVSFLVCILGFYIESKAKYFWNSKLNKIIYYLSANNKDYIIEKKEFTYTCLENNAYKCEKKYSINPTSNNLDNMTERFAWSAPSFDANISPIDPKHEITDKWQQGLWTYYSVFFHETCKKNEIFTTGSIISDLIDTNNKALPYLSVTVSRKTKQLLMRVCFENGDAPKNASFKVYSSKNLENEIFSEELKYDKSIKGFKKSIDYPRQNWKYTISW